MKYDRPEVEVIDLKTDEIICQSVCDGEVEPTPEECWFNDTE